MWPTESVPGLQAQETSFVLRSPCPKRAMSSAKVTSVCKDQHLRLRGPLTYEQDEALSFVQGRSIESGWPDWRALLGSSVARHLAASITLDADDETLHLLDAGTNYRTPSKIWFF